MKRLIIFAQLLLLACLGIGQSGDFYIKEFSIHLPNIDNDNYAIVQDEAGRMRIANRKGILKFDGTFWGITHTPGTVFSIKNDSIAKTTYVGCINDFGYIKVDHTGHESYKSLAEGHKEAKNVAKIDVLGDYVYFLAENALFQYSKPQALITKVYKGHITNTYILNNELYACYGSDSIVNMTMGKKVVVKNLPSSQLVFTTPVNSRTVLLGTADNHLYTLTGSAFTKLKLHDSTYIQNYELLDAIIIGRETA
ncbi:MAG TPA: hypothetical protein VL947_10660, partial [Cytophagales bacterium]|nr:hypothetical protein [Cytophagales bacterium]